MPPRSAEEKARRRQLAAERKAAREAKKRAEEEQKQKLAEQKLQNLSLNNNKSVGEPCVFLNVPEVTLGCIFSFLPARELACVSLTCTTFNYSIGELRISYIQQQLSKTRLCASRQEALDILKASYGGGDTRRVVTRKQRKSDGRDCDEFMAYARFVEEGINGHCKLAVGRGGDPIILPSSMNGRYASVSPEHSLVRVGGDGYKSGAGGSGAASWGVGRRGQLGHGERIDYGRPQRLLGGLGYGIRIVQVSAGGGLVRVAHSLFLTSSGRVLSCGNGSYGQLGHGYSQAKQLPDYMRPKYIDAFNGMKMVCVSAGEIHSAAVNSDGDLFTFGDGFLGMLGHGDKRPQVSPKQVEYEGVEDECFSTVSCGCRHTLAVTEDGEVFSMGFGHFGVLGRAFTPFEYDADAALENLGIGDLEADQGFQPLPQNPVIAQAAAPVEEDPVLREEREREELQAHLELIANMTLDDASTQCLPQIIDSLQGIDIIGVSAGHRHSIFLEKQGGVYTCGSGVTGALGHGDNISQMYPMKVMEFDHCGTKIMQISAGVDLSMAVSTDGCVYSWGKADGGRLGLPKTRGIVNTPRVVQVETKAGNQIKAIDVECGYVHSLIIGLDGTLHQCGGVGIDGAEDGQQEEVDEMNLGKPVQIKDFNIWHRMPEPKAAVKQKERWKKYGKYELQGRSKMMANRE